MVIRRGWGEERILMLALRCVAYPYEGRWVGLCLDLDIAVEAESDARVFEVMKAAVNDYVASAMQEAEPVRKRLLQRRAPWYVRWPWAWRIFLATAKADRKRDDAIEFPVQCLA